MLARHHVSTSPARLHYGQLADGLAARYGANSREIDPGHWAFEVLTGEGRSQVVHVLLREQHAADVDVSRLVVSSPVGPLGPRTNLEALLRRNAALDVGAVCVEELRTDDEGKMPYVTIRAACPLRTADAEAVWEMVERVADAADALEKDLFVRDVF